MVGHRHAPRTSQVKPQLFSAPLSPLGHAWGTGGPRGERRVMRILWEMSWLNKNLPMLEDLKPAQTWMYWKVSYQPSFPSFWHFRLKKTRPCDFSETIQVSIYRCEQDHTLPYWSPTFFPCTARDSLGPKEWRARSPNCLFMRRSDCILQGTFAHVPSLKAASIYWSTRVAVLLTC